MTRDTALDLLEQHIVRLLGFHPPGLDRVLEACEVLECKAGETLLRPGNPARQLWFIAQGSAMMAQPGPDKEEHIADLLFESDWVTDLQAFMQETPAAYRIECLEDAVLCAFSRDSFLALRRDLPPFAEGFQRVITSKYLAAQERATMLANLDARARVHWLLTEKPEWFRRVKDKWLAALLGMSRETFSRLKP